MRSIRLALFVFLVVSVVPLLAQTSFTSVRGTITDTSGALIPNAQVKLVNGATNAEINGTSDSSGLYQFPQLAPGTYTVTVNVYTVSSTDAASPAVTSTFNLTVN